MPITPTGATGCESRVVSNCARIRGSRGGDSAPRAKHRTNTYRSSRSQPVRRGVHQLPGSGWRHRLAISKSYGPEFGAALCTCSVIGRRSGPRLFKPEARIFKTKYRDEADLFVAKYGPLALVMARFVPVVRTYISPIVSASKMGPVNFSLGRSQERSFELHRGGDSSDLSAADCCQCASKADPGTP